MNTQRDTHCGDGTRLAAVGLLLFCCSAFAQSPDRMDGGGPGAPQQGDEQAQQAAPPAETGPGLAAAEEGQIRIQAPVPGVENDAATTKPEIRVHGFLSTWYRYRQSGDAHDQDIYQYLGVDVGAPESSPISVHFLARVTADIDGRQDSRGLYVFDSITDTYDENINGRLYYGYVDVHRLGTFGRARLGRQQIYEAPVVTNFDGVRVDTKPLPRLGSLQVGLYGGVPVHLFESSASGDVLFGAFARAKLWPGGRVEIHWTHVEDEAVLTDQRDDLYALRAWQTVNNYFRVHLGYTRLEGEDRDVLVRTTIAHPDWDLRVQASYYELLETQKDLTLEFEPYFASAFEYFPYRQVRLQVSKGWQDRFTLDGGFDLRELDDDSNETRFNHAFHRYFLAPSLCDWPVKGLEIQVTGEVWDTKLRAGDNRTVSGDVTYQINERFKASLGTAYSLFKYDYYQDFERDDVRSYYARLRATLSKSMRCEVRYAYEDDDFAAYHVIRLGFRHRF